METSDIFRIGFRLNNLFFPADLFDFAQVLAAKGYTLLGRIGPKRPIPVAYIGGTLDPMATKNDILVDVNTDRGVIGVTASTVESVIEGTKEIAQVFEQDFYVNKENFMFFEFSGQMHRVAKRNPVESMSKMAEDVKYVERCSKILGTDVGIRTIKLSPKNISPSDIRFFELTVEPSLIHPDKVFVASVIYREKDLASLAKAITNINNQVKQIIDYLES